jgi:protein gp37
VRFSETRLEEPSALAESADIIIAPHGDAFHENLPDVWLDRIFDVVDACPWHRFQVLTKRAQRMQSYWSRRYRAAPPHVVLGVSCERQKEADERIPLLQANAAATRSVTLYPLLSAIDLRLLLARGGIDLVAVGEEPERPAPQAWFDRIAADCAAAGVSFLPSSRLVGEAA